MVKPNKCNAQGRLLEWVMTLRLYAFCVNQGVDCAFTAAAAAANLRDSAYLEAQDEELIADFKSCADTFVKWIDEQNWLDGAVSTKIDRLSDAAAKGNNPDTSDITLEIKYKGRKTVQKKISVKSHHDALKHPRLPSLPDHLGITDEKEKVVYKKEYKKIWNSFVAGARLMTGNKTTFPDLERIDPKYKEDELYSRLNKLVVKLLKKHKNDKKAAKTFFNYLVSKTEFIVVKNGKKAVTIKHFEGICSPNSMRRIIYPYAGHKNTFFVEFDNNWKITFRIHNASSEFYRNGKANITEKLDVLCINLVELIPNKKLLKVPLTS